MKCPVCKSDIKEKQTVCLICGFDDIRTEFINNDDRELWLQSTVKPCISVHNTLVKEQIELEKKLTQAYNDLAEANRKLTETYDKLTAEYKAHTKTLNELNVVLKEKKL